MFRTLMSDDGAHVLLFHEGQDEPEEMELWQFTAMYGEPDGMRNLPPNVATELEPDDINHYYKSFRRLVDLCGDYEHKRKLLQNVDEGVLKAQVVAYDYYGPVPDRKLVDTVKTLESLRKMAVGNLDYWSCRVGFKPMSKPEDVKKYGLKGQADTEKLLKYLYYKDFRKRLRYRIDKYAKKAELKSAAELVSEVFASYKKKRPVESS